MIFKTTTSAALAAAVLLVSGITPTNTQASDQSEQRCLALNIYFEARGASQVDKEAVGHVTINRSKSRHFPRTICGVVYQPSQFGWVRSLNSHTPREAAAWRASQELATELLAGDVADPANGATYFYDHRSGNPAWARRFEVTLKTRGHTYLRRN